MNSRERVMRAIEFKGPDRVPWNYYIPPRGDVFSAVALPPKGWMPPEPYCPYWIIPEMMKLGMWRPNRPLPRDWYKKSYQGMDEWGCIWEVDGEVSFKGQIRKGALEDSWELLDSYRPPDMRDPSRYKLFRFFNILGRRKYRLACADNWFFERFLFLRGFEQGMMDLVMHPEQVDRLLDLMEDHYLGFVEMAAKMGANGVEFVDDLGTQQNSLISPSMFQRFFKPRYARLARRAHELGMHLSLHSCGNIGPLIPDIIDTGIDALQLDSPNQTGLDTLAELAGGKIAFFNVVDVQRVLPEGSPEEIEAYVKEMIEKLGSFNGGLVATTYPTLYSIGANKQQEKIMFDAYRKHGSYR